jgi:hypothetical protein
MSGKESLEDLISRVSGQSRNAVRGVMSDAHLLYRTHYFVRAEDERYALKEAYREGVGCFTTLEEAEAADDSQDDIFEVVVTRITTK